MNNLPRLRRACGFAARVLLHVAIAVVIGLVLTRLAGRWPWLLYAATAAVAILAVTRLWRLARRPDRMRAIAELATGIAVMAALTLAIGWLVGDGGPARPRITEANEDTDIGAVFDSGSDHALAVVSTRTGETSTISAASFLDELGPVGWETAIVPGRLVAGQMSVCHEVLEPDEAQGELCHIGDRIVYARGLGTASVAIDADHPEALDDLDRGTLAGTVAADFAEGLGTIRLDAPGDCCAEGPNILAAQIDENSVTIHIVDPPAEGDEIIFWPAHRPGSPVVGRFAGGRWALVDGATDQSLDGRSIRIATDAVSGSITTSGGDRFPDIGRLSIGGEVALPIGARAIELAELEAEAQLTHADADDTDRFAIESLVGRRLTPGTSAFSLRIDGNEETLRAVVTIDELGQLAQRIDRLATDGSWVAASAYIEEADGARSCRFTNVWQCEQIDPVDGPLHRVVAVVAGDVLVVEPEDGAVCIESRPDEDDPTERVCVLPSGRVATSDDGQGLTLVSTAETDEVETGLFTISTEEVTP